MCNCNESTGVIVRPEKRKYRENDNLMILYHHGFKIMLCEYMMRHC